MMSRRPLIVALLSVLLGACDLLVDAPTNAAPEVRFQLATSADPTMALVLSHTNRIRIALTRGGLTKDTLLGARATDGVVTARARILPPPGSGPTTVFAQALVDDGVVFEGRGTISAGPNPSTTVLLDPVPGRLVATQSGQFLTSFGEELQLWSEVSFVTGELWEGAFATWTSSDPDVIAVDSEHRATPRGNGAATLVARYGPLTREVEVQVLQTPRTITSITPGDTTITVGESIQIGVTGEDLSGSPLLAGANITWETEGGIAINFRGVATAGAVGPATVTAVLGDTRHSVSIVVVPST